MLDPFPDGLDVLDELVMPLAILTLKLLEVVVQVLSVVSLQLVKHDH